MDLYLFAIGVIVALIAARMVLHTMRKGNYREIFETSSRQGALPEAMVNSLRDAGVRYRIVYKGPANQPFIGMSGEQFVALEVHVEDMAKAKPIVTQILHEAGRNRR